jgi:hypothetical protein
MEENSIWREKGEIVKIELHKYHVLNKSLFKAILFSDGVAIKPFNSGL